MMGKNNSLRLIFVGMLSSILTMGLSRMELSTGNLDINSIMLCLTKMVAEIELKHLILCLLISSTVSLLFQLLPPFQMCSTTPLDPDPHIQSLRDSNLALDQSFRFMKDFSNRVEVVLKLKNLNQVLKVAKMRTTLKWVRSQSKERESNLQNQVLHQSKRIKGLRNETWNLKEKNWTLVAQLAKERKRKVEKAKVLLETQSKGKEDRRKEEPQGKLTWWEVGQENQPSMSTPIPASRKRSQKVV